MPLNASKALHWLGVAAQYGYLDMAINTYNPCCCLERLNRGDEALDKAESYWQRQRVSPLYPGYLWVRDGESLTLTANGDPEISLVELAIRTATALGLTTRAARWEQRLGDLTMRTSEQTAY